MSILGGFAVTILAVLIVFTALCAFIGVNAKLMERDTRR
jgi:hypothetical protein